MYDYSITERAATELKKGSIPNLLRKERIIDDIGELRDNPLKRAKPTGNSHFGDYYINCGARYCVLFNINEPEKTIEILRVVSRSRLYRFLTGKIDGKTF